MEEKTISPTARKENIENLYVADDDIMITKIYNFRFLLISVGCKVTLGKREAIF
jgi:hypothetical protein